MRILILLLESLHVSCMLSHEQLCAVNFDTIIDNHAEGDFVVVLTKANVKFHGHCICCLQAMCMVLFHTPGP